jgi:hypothetical protein
MLVEQLRVEHERELRRWLTSRDSDLAFHRQLRDYFLAPTASFGVMALRNINGTLQALAMFSRFDGKAFVHRYITDNPAAEEFGMLLAQIGLPCQIFLSTDQVIAADPRWQLTLVVTPGYVVDHPAYDGVFSRVAPRFAGHVYETGE